MKAVAKTTLEQLCRQDPARLLQIAIGQSCSLRELTLEAQTLREENRALRMKLETIGQDLAVKVKRLGELEAQLQESQRAGHRQAAPFRREEQQRAATPKRPGRKLGHAGTYRPKPDHIDKEIKVELCCCPHCQSTDFCDQVEVEQFIEDVPPVRPQVTRLRTFQAKCAKCGETVSSTHPLQMSLATGAAGVHLGPQALAIAADLNKAKGLSMRKTCAVLRDCFGLQLTPGGLSQALDRMAARLEPQFEELMLELREAVVVHGDETSWWVGGKGWWLWVFTNAQTTVYLVEDNRKRDVIHQTLGADFGGVLVSDCLSIYDDANSVQQKCYSHHHKAIKEAKKIHPKEGEGYLCQLQALLRAATALKEQKAELEPERFSSLRAALEGKATKLLKTPRDEPSEESVRNRLFKQRDHLFTFLDYEEVDATNNLAERQLRPAVIARKISCGNKTTKGAHTWQILASLAATCTQREQSFIQMIASAVPLNSG